MFNKSNKKKKGLQRIIYDVEYYFFKEIMKKTVDLAEIKNFLEFSDGGVLYKKNKFYKKYKKVINILVTMLCTNFYIL